MYRQRDREICFHQTCISCNPSLNDMFMFCADELKSKLMKKLKNAYTKTQKKKPCFFYFAIESIFLNFELKATFNPNNCKSKT